MLQAAIGEGPGILDGPTLGRTSRFLSHGLVNEMPDKMISDEDVRKALERSGYLLEYRLVTLLRERKYWVRANSAVPDPYTSKWRELDLRTVKKVTRHAEEFGCFIFGEILVECANNPQPIAFMTRKAEDSILYREDVKLSGYPLYVLTGTVREYWSPLHSYLSFQNFHHYCNGWVATQWCSFQERKDGKSKPKDERQWMAFHRDQDHEVFRKLCFAVDHFMNEHYSRLTFEDEEPVDIAVFFPVMVVQGRLLDVIPFCVQGITNLQEHIGSGPKPSMV